MSWVDKTMHFNSLTSHPIPLGGHRWSSIRSNSTQLVPGQHHWSQRKLLLRYPCQSFSPVGSISTLNSNKKGGFVCTFLTLSEWKLNKIENKNCNGLLDILCFKLSDRSSTCLTAVFLGALTFNAYIFSGHIIQTFYRLKESKYWTSIHQLSKI